VTEKKKPATPTAKTPPPVRAKSASKSRDGAASAGSAPADPVPERRWEAADYQRAIKSYSACLELVQRKGWQQASRSLADFIAEFAAERELAERARMYLRVCAQHLDAHDMTPKDFDEACYLAVVLANQGEYARALKALDMALAERPGSDRAHYLRASTLTLHGDRPAALAALRRAIELEDRNRVCASQDPDFRVLHDDEEFITLTTREDEGY
jgi:tetratricopeptide (TPR) repeat protein